jgi:hypothetical protein
VAAVGPGAGAEGVDVEAAVAAAVAEAA